MSNTPLADGIARRKAYRGWSVFTGGAGLLLAVYGFASGEVWAIVAGLILFLVVGFVLHVAANATMNTAISIAAEAAGGRSRNAEYISAIHGMHVHAFQQASRASLLTGRPIDDAFREEMRQLTGA